MTDEKILKSIIAEYEELRINSANNRKKRIEDVNEKFPRIAQINKEIYKRGMENTKRIFKNPEKSDEYNADFKKNRIILEEEKKKILTENKIPLDYDKYKYECEICSDTGYDANGKKCKCFKQKLINKAYSTSNMSDMIKKQNFDLFSFDYYSKDRGENGISEYDNIIKIYNNCKKFCSDFDKELKGIVFYGGTGLGKTFLSSSIAKELMDNGKTVMYVRATKLFSINEDYKFGRNTDKSVIDNIYDADLLIIDDLGTEPFNKNNLSFLFDIVNERTAEGKKIIINTNLRLDEITKVYSMRFTSRLYEHFKMYKFYGEDIRIQKLKM